MTEDWNSQVIGFDSTIIDDSKRIIEGVATAPIYDRTNELITADAIKKALPAYMVLPILTVQHKEFVAGLVKKAWFDENDRLHIKAQLKNTKDVDRVWELIKSGELNSFSISGTRNETTCNLSSNAPCVTSDICLNAITICGDNAINQAAYFDVVNKSKKVTTMVEEIKPEEATTPVVEQPQQPDFTGIAKALIAELQGAGMLSKSSDEDKKESSDENSSEDVSNGNDSTEEKKAEEEKDDEFKKSLDAHAEEIASLKRSLDELTEKINTLTKAVERIDNEPLNKATAYTIQNGNVVSVSLNDMQKSVNAPVENPFKAALVKMRSE